MSPVALIARREITSRLQQRGYRVGFALGLLIVVLACVVPSFFNGNDKASTYDVGVAVDNPGLNRALAAIGTAQGVHVHVHETTVAHARKDVDSGKLDAAVLPGNVLVVKHPSDAVATVVQDAFQIGVTLDRLRRAGLTDRQVRAALSVRPLRVHATASSKSTEKATIAVIAVVLLFSQLITFCAWVATGVVEEKASRVVELVLSSVRPLQLLTGKLLGIGVLASGQVLALGLAALLAATAAGTLTLPASAFLTLLVAFVGFLFGFAFFAALAAGLGSTVSRQEEVSGILAPVTITLTICYAAAFSAASSPDTTLSRVLSIVPPVSAIAMPARFARGGVPLLDVVLAVVLLAVVTAGIVAVAARVYRASILHSGTRVPLRRAWRGEAVADIS